MYVDWTRPSSPDRHLGIIKKERKAEPWLCPTPTQTWINNGGGYAGIRTSVQCTQPPPLMDNCNPKTLVDQSPSGIWLEGTYIYTPINHKCSTTL
jgi:hypothetical protein